MSILQFAETMLARALPGQCHLCGGTCQATWLCDACELALPPWRASEACPVCARTSTSGLTCGRCLTKSPAFDATQAVWRYAFPVDTLIQDLKYRLNLSSVRFFASALAGQRSRRPPDLILPVPLSASRLRTRGFNQSVEISRRLAHQYGLPLALTQVRRGLDRLPQASLPWKEREANVRGAFECQTEFSGRSVLVIDDVMTTGATLNELARALKAHGAIWVENLVLARVLAN